ncbi:PREDICTED: uncharacterized protein LOC109162584 [Ipomoea nil]|uniref:uncharacterized protein LOC109162584 n=1 Tax=Ipomoea nil TaxID=35883 RepID=UPI000900C5AE|nr:PREDICTED: uncharacterized protein LOC109162584 [Ipomoea nil]
MASIIEPMLTQDSLAQMTQALGFSDGFASSESKIWLLWTTDFEVEVECDNGQFVSCNVVYLPWQFRFRFVSVYAKHTRGERLHLWAQLAILLNSPLPILMGGDFNVISSVTEYQGSAWPDTNSIADFSSFIRDNALIDLDVIGNLYTWHGVRTTGPVWKRLDRFLINTVWRDSFSDIRICALARTTSDHAPLLLHGANSSLSALKQFRFQNMWLTHPDFMEIVRNSWEQSADGGGMRALSYKLKRLKMALKDWNKHSFGNIFGRIKTLESEVALAECRHANNPSGESRTALQAKQADLMLALKQEESFWKQKARVKWVKEGDANTRYFHSVVKDRHRRQRISSVKSAGGHLLTDQREIQEEAVTFYSSLFSAEDCPNLEPLF